MVLLLIVIQILEICNRSIRHFCDSKEGIFAIIYDAYIHLNDEIYDVIEDIYTELEYPKEISNLIGYMPCDDGRSMDEKLNQYIEIGKNRWC